MIRVSTLGGWGTRHPAEPPPSADDTGDPAEAEVLRFTEEAASHVEGWE